MAYPGDTLDVAINFLSRHQTGWYIFPIQRGKKKPPCFKNELELASNNLLQIRKWHASYRGCNWGLSLKKSKIIVIDVDTKPGKVGMETLENLTAKHGDLPETFVVRTPSGGWHFYFAEANGVVHKHRLGAGGFGEDIDSTNYVLLPGCTLDETNEFPGLYEPVNDTPVAPAPEWFGTYLRETKNTPDADQEAVIELDSDMQVAWAIDYLTNDAPPAVQGNNGEFTLLMVAGVLKDHGISEDTAVELLLEHYNERCNPPWGAFDGPVEDRLDVKVHNSRLYLKKTAPGAFTPAAEFADDVEEDYGDAIFKVEPHPSVTEEVIEGWRKDIRAKKDAAKDAPGDDGDAAVERQAQAAEDEWMMGPSAEPTEQVEEDVSTAAAAADEDDSWMMGGAPKSSTNKPMIPLGEIDESVKPDYKIHKDETLNVLCNRWVWVIGIKRFVNRLAPTMNWEGSQFDSAYNYLCPKGAASISRYLFKRKDLLRRFDYIAFRPGHPEVNGNEYNVWRPSPVVPKPGDTTLWNNHLEYLFPDENDRNGVLNWMAWVVQNPSRKPNHALLIVGRETGTGKSWVARVMEQIIGENNTQRPKNSSMGGDFNSWLKDCRLCLLEEVMQVGRRENINAMRDLITETSVEVNMKGVPAFKIPNYAAMLGITNHTDALPVDDKDRRWFIKETLAETLPPDMEAAYYAPLLAAVPAEPGMPAADPDMVPAIYQELLDRKIEDFPLVTKDRDGNETKIIYNGLSRAPWSLAKENMIDLSRSDAETWLIENAGSGVLTRNVVTITDIQDAMPVSIQRVNRLTTSIIPNFLRDRLKGVKHPIQIRLNNKTRVRVWVLHGRYDMLKDRLPEQYEGERKAGNKQADAEQRSDFEDAN